MFDLAFIDLDGTLLNSACEVSPRARAAVRDLAARGIYVVLASGRPPRMVRRYQRDLALGGPAICYNGAYISSAPDGGVLWENRLTPADAGAAVDVLRRGGVVNILCEANDRLAGELESELFSVAQRDGWGLRDDLDLDGALADGVHKLLAACEPEKHAKLAGALLAALPGRIDLVTSAPGTPWLEILPAGSSKAAAAEMVCRVLGTRLTRALAFGDAENDAALLAQVALGIAMANGDPKAKAAAKRIAPANDEDGLALVVEELLAAG